MTAHLWSFALAILAWSGAATSPTFTAAHLPWPGDPLAFDHIAGAGAVVAGASEPSLLTGTIAHAPTADSCAAGTARYMLVTRQGRV